MFDIDKRQVTISGKTLIVEASDVRLNFWPDFISVTEERNGGREGILFLKGRPDMNGDEVAGYRYFSKNGFELLVIND